MRERGQTKGSAAFEGIHKAPVLMDPLKKGVTKNKGQIQTQHV